MNFQAGTMPHHILLLTTAQTYRAQAFLDAAQALDIGCTMAFDMDAELAADGRHGWGFPFANTQEALRHIQRFHARTPLKAIIALDDAGSLLAATASVALNLPHNSPDSAIAARDKFVMRRKLASHALNCPRFVRVAAQDSVTEVAAHVGYPLVIKPLDRNGSQGVMRIDTEAELRDRIPRLQSILQSDPAAPRADFLIESYIPGNEIAVEAIIVDQKLEVLAIFDKPDPLEGPFFEESIYVTPSRLPTAVQEEIGQATAQATQALGLGFGPVHAELRINDEGLWILEVAGRSIGGLCSNVLNFGASESLEALILQHACGQSLPDLKASREARGVMMIPIPHAGLFQGVAGVTEALQVPGITSVDITAVIGYTLQPLPEGNSYLGFIFAAGTHPADVEDALRQAYACLDIRIMPAFDLTMW